MDAGKPRTDAIIARLARQQSGALSRQQLLAENVDRRAIDRRIANETFRTLHEGVYFVGPDEPGQLAIAWAAVLAVGGDAAISHRTAAELEELLTYKEGDAPHVTTSARTGHNPRGIRVHRPRTFHHSQVQTHNELRLTRTEFTIADLAATESERTVQRALNQATFLGIVDLDHLRELAHRRKGARLLRRTIQRASRTRSYLEDEFVGMVHDAGLPIPLCNWGVGAYNVDFLWLDQRFVVETDGWGHENDLAWATDHRKTGWLEKQGFEVLRVTSHRFSTARSAVLADVAAGVRSPRGRRRLHVA